jgi:hypothetical protein
MPNINNKKLKVPVFLKYSSILNTLGRSIEIILNGVHVSVSTFSGLPALLAAPLRPPDGLSQKLCIRFQTAKTLS